MEHWREIKNQLTRTSYLALSMACWISRATESYFTVMVHYVLDWEIRSMLQTGPLYEIHASTCFVLKLMNVVTEWKLERSNIAISVTTDDAQNIVDAICEIDGFGPHIGHFAYTLNFVAKRAVSLMALSCLLGKVRNVVIHCPHHHHMHKSTTAHVLTVNQDMQDIPKHTCHSPLEYMTY